MKERILSEQKQIQEQRFHDEEEGGEPTECPCGESIEHALNPMNEAPKDGSWIVIFYESEADMAVNGVEVRIAHWWCPTDKQASNGCAPHWEYITDDDYWHDIDNPFGWLPIPRI